jgi:hypothetical protein
MSTERYGMMREVEYDFLDEITLKLKVDFGKIQFLEIGVCGAGTTRGMYRRAVEIGCPIKAAGVDLEMYRPNPTPSPDYRFHAGDSMDAWRNITSQFNLLLVDGCHCVNHSMCDFLNYSPFVVVGGLVLFHDTALPTALGKTNQEAWPQDHSYAGQPPSSLGVREGLQKLGLLQGHRADWKLIREIPSDTGLMGMALFQKIKAL